MESRDLCVGCYSQVWPLTQFLFCFRAFVGNFFKPILDFVKPTEKNWNRVSDQICPHNRVGRSKSQLGGSGGGPGVLGGWGLGNVCLLQMHSNAILGPHPGPSPELSKTPSCQPNKIGIELVTRPVKQRRWGVQEEQCIFYANLSSLHRLYSISRLAKKLLARSYSSVF